MILMNKYLLLFVVTSFVIIADQVSKCYIVSNFRLYESVMVIDNFFHITYILNPGAAFGIFAGKAAHFRIPFFISVSIAAIIGIIVFYRNINDRFLEFALSLILAGAAGNLIDRVRLGEVIDFIDVHWYSKHWPAFNVADSAITIGVAMMMLDSFFGKKGKIRT